MMDEYNKYIDPLIRHVITGKKTTQSYNLTLGVKEMFSLHSSLPLRRPFVGWTWNASRALDSSITLYRTGNL